MTQKGLIYILDMESSLSEALAHRVISMGQHIIFRRWDEPVDVVSELAAYKDSLKGIILSGSWRNVNSQKKPPPSVPVELFQTNIPILAICYGMQYLAHLQGIEIVRCWKEPDLAKRTKVEAKKDPGEQGPVLFTRTEEDSVLFQGLGNCFPVWMKHNWMLSAVPPGWRKLGSTTLCPIAAMELGNLFALQFHPELNNSLFGRIILHNFLERVCGLKTPYF